MLPIYKPNLYIFQKSSFPDFYLGNPMTGSFPFSNNAGLQLWLESYNSDSFLHGEVWRDLSGFQRDLQIQNQIIFDYYNKVFQLNTSLNSYFSSPNVNFNFSGNGNRSLEMWVNPAATQLAFANIFDFNHVAGGFTVQMSGLNSFYISRGIAVTSTPVQLRADTWNHVVWSINNDANTLVTTYLNGVAMSISFMGGAYSNLSYPLMIGRWINGGRFFNGKIAVVKVYNMELNLYRVNYNFRRERGFYGV
jgi:hypothetical protein